MKFLEKIKLMAFSVIALVFGLIPNTASAACSFWEGCDFSIGSAFLSMIKGGLEATALAFQFVMGLILSLVGGVLDFMLSWNFKITDESFNEIAVVGWQITRDVANLGFVLALIMIAFATILRFQQYGAKKLLVKLIAAVLLVNFSFAIAAGFINFSNGLADIFLTNSGVIEGGDIDLAGSLMGALGGQNLFLNPEDPDAEDSGIVGDLGEDFVGLLAGVIFTIALMGLLIIILAGFAFMLLIRYVYLTILIILAPLAWLFWVMPNLQQHFSKWWDKFLKWTFFAPTVAFFIYLSIISANMLGGDEWETVQTLGTTAGVSDILQGLMQYGIRITVLGAIMIGGVFAAESMGIHGASATIKVANEGKRRAQGYVGGKARRVRDATLAGGKNQEGKTLAERTAESNMAQKIPGLRSALRGVAGASRKAKERQKERTKEREQEISERESGKAAAQGINQTQRLESVGGGARPTPIGEKTIARAMHAAKEGHFDDISEQLQSKIIKAVRKQGREDELLPYAPDHAAEIKGIEREDYDSDKEYQQAAQKAREDAISRMPKLAEFSEGMQTKITQNAEYTVNMPTHRFDEVGKGEGIPQAQRQNIYNTLRGVVGDKFDEIKDLEKDLDKAKQDIKDARNRNEDAETISALQNRRDIAKKELKDQKDKLGDTERRAFDKLDRMMDDKLEDWRDIVKS